MSGPEEKGAAQIPPDLAATTSSTAPAITESQLNKNTLRTRGLQNEPDFDPVSLILPKAFQEMYPNETETFPCPTVQQVADMPLRFFVGDDDVDREANRERCAWGLFYEEDITPAEWWGRWQAEQKAEAERIAVCWAENTEWNRKVFAELERTRTERLILSELERMRPERLAAIVASQSKEKNLDVLLDLFDTAWIVAREGPINDQKMYFVWRIRTMTAMAKALATLLSDRGETCADESLIFVVDGGLEKSARAVVTADRGMKAFILAEPEAAPETIVESAVRFFSQLGMLLRAEDIDLRIHTGRAE
jgi:hypothetical protein